MCLYFLSQGSILGLSCIVLALVLESAIYFSREPWILLVENDIQKLRCQCWCFYCCSVLLLPGLLNGRSWEVYVCTPTRTHTYTYIICLAVYIEKRELIPIIPVSVQHSRVPSFFIFHVCNILKVKSPASAILTMFTYLFNFSVYLTCSQFYALTILLSCWGEHSLKTTDFYGSLILIIWNQYFISWLYIRTMAQ